MLLVLHADWSSLPRADWLLSLTDRSEGKRRAD